MSDRPTDPPADDRELLVAAFVDGEATPEERARVEADPVLLALADRYRATKAMIADVAPLASSKRESFLAAALAEHAVLTSSASEPAATAAAPSAADVRPITPRRRPLAHPCAGSPRPLLSSPCSPVARS